MKKLQWILTLTIALSLLLAACSQPAEAPTEAPEAPAPTEAAPMTGALPDLGGKTITVAVENAYPPFNMIDSATNQGTGWDYDVLAEICKRLNCKPEFKQAAWDGIFPAMEAGEFDMLADGVTITAEREEIVDFSMAYVTVGQVVLTRADETRSVDDMKADRQRAGGHPARHDQRNRRQRELPRRERQVFRRLRRFRVGFAR